MDKKTLGILAILAAGGYLLYSISDSGSKPPVKVPNGSSYGGWLNNTGAAVYITAAGDIVNSVGNIIASIQNLTNSNNNSNDDPTAVHLNGQYEGGLM